MNLKNSGTIKTFLCSTPQKEITRSCTYQIVMITWFTTSRKRNSWRYSKFSNAIASDLSPPVLKEKERLANVKLKETSRADLKPSQFYNRWSKLGNYQIFRTIISSHRKIQTDKLNHNLIAAWRCSEVRISSLRISVPKRTISPTAAHSQTVLSVLTRRATWWLTWDYCIVAKTDELSIASQ